MSNSLQGQPIKICANDFFPEDLLARVILVCEEEKKILLKLDNVLVSSGEHYEYVVVSPRLAKNSIDDLLSTGVLGSSVTWVPETRFDVKKPLDLSWWRGGAVAVTDVRLAGS